MHKQNITNQNTTKSRLCVDFTQSEVNHRAESDLLALAGGVAPHGLNQRCGPLRGRERIKICIELACCLMTPLWRKWKQPLTAKMLVVPCRTLKMKGAGGRWWETKHPHQISSRVPLRPKIKVKFHVPGKCMWREGGFSTFIMQRELGCDEGWRQK